jgi:hypothetical protein
MESNISVTKLYQENLVGKQCVGKERGSRFSIWA